MATIARWPSPSPPPDPSPSPPRSVSASSPPMRSRPVLQAFRTVNSRRPASRGSRGTHVVPDGKRTEALIGIGDAADVDTDAVRRRLLQSAAGSVATANSVSSCPRPNLTVRLFAKRWSRASPSRPTRSPPTSPSQALEACDRRGRRWHWCEEPGCARPRFGARPRSDAGP